MPYLARPDGCRLYVEVHGDPAATALILLEGMGGDVPGWRRNIPHLANEHRVVTFDHRGNGRSDSPDVPMTMTTFVDDALAVLDDQRIPRSHVYGQSFGGMVAQELGLTHPQRVRSLVLASTHAGPAHAVRDRTRAKAPKDRPYLALYSEAFANEHPDHVADDILVGSQRPQPLHAGRRQWDAMQDWSSWGRLRSLACPTLVLHGSEDRIVPVANAKLLAERIPGAELVILEGAGHLYHSEQPEHADAAVLDFLRRVEADGG
jgi:pimeloyl-ACP methyl ester carboxylesterase